MKGLALLVLAAIACGCNGAKDARGSSSAVVSVSAIPSAAAPAESAVRERLGVLLEAEHRRAPNMVEDSDLASRDPFLRRAAARALARIAGKRARTKLLRALSDEDADVTMWAAYGLGFDCADARDATVDALVARAIALPEADAYDAAFTAIARAVGACASPAKSEATLSAWLGGKTARASAACLGLGDLAARNKKLLEETWVSLLGRAEGGVANKPMPEALYPVSRVDNVPPTVVDRLATVASARLSDAGPYRLFAIRALTRAKAQALSPLERVLLTDASAFTMPERVEAVVGANRLGGDGQVLLGKLLDKMAPAAAAALEQPDQAPVLLAALRVFSDPKAAPKSLAAIASLAPLASASARTRRIASLVRCAAAKAPPTVKPTDPTLVACDLDKGWIGKSALAEVLGRTELRAAELALFHTLANDTDARVREAAVGLLAAHLEITDSAALIAAALRAKEPGVVTTAADQIQKNAAVASLRATPKKKEKKGKPDKKDDKKPADNEPIPPPVKDVEVALVAALDRAERENDLEMLGTVVDAIGALGQKSLVSRIQPFCSSSEPWAREHAASALALLAGGKKPVCDPPERADAIEPEALAPAVDEVIVLLETDAGKLELALDGSIAPVTAARIAALVKRGYYDGNVLHRVDPSFVVQFGSPFADGASGPPDLPLRCETSPMPFDTLAVGVALAGRDTGGSQLFVMRARHPHLDGNYPLVGRAKGPWDAIMEGDTIIKATLVGRP